MLTFPLQNFDWDKQANIFEADNSSSLHIDNKKKYILVYLVKVHQKKLSDTTATAEAKYSTNFTKSRRKLCLRLPNIGSFNFCLLMA